MLGKHSGRHALRSALAELGYQLDDEQLEKLFDDFKLLGRQEEGDLRRRPGGAGHPRPATSGAAQRTWDLSALSTTSGTGTLPAASIALQKRDGTRHQDACGGDGPVDAVFKAIEQITGIESKLRDYQIQARDGGRGRPGRGDPRGRARHRRLPRARRLHRRHRGQRAQAFLDVVNRIALKLERSAALDQAAAAEEAAVRELTP